MKRRVKDRWHNSTPENSGRDVLGEKTLEDQAGALAYIIWRQSLNEAINLHAEDFRYDDDHQRIGVISELLAFGIQHVDRLSHAFLNDAERTHLVTTLCHRVADQVQDNLTDIAGPGNYIPPFLMLLNQRFANYAELGYRDDEPAYETYRFLGAKVLEIMGDDQTNRWVIDQIIDIDAPDFQAQITKSLGRLFGRDRPGV